MRLSIRQRVLFIVCALAIFTGFAGAQTIDEVMAKHFEARGGAERLNAMKSYAQAGSLDMGNGQTATLVLTQKRPNLVRMDLVLPNATATRAYDGKNGWMFMPHLGHKQPEPADPATLKQLIEESDFGGALLQWKEKGHKLEIAGREAVDGRECHKVELTRASGGTQRNFFLDVDTCLVTRVSGADKDGVFTQTLSDYRKVEGLMFPFTSVVELTPANAPPQKFVYKTNKLEVNADIPDSHFAMPTTAPSK